MGFKWTDKIDNIDKIYAKDINDIAKQVVNLSNAAKPMIVVTAKQMSGNFIIDAPWFNNTVLNNGDMFYVKPQALDQIKVYSRAYIQFADQGEYSRPYQIITPTNKSEFLPDFFNHDIPFVVIYETNAADNPYLGGFIVIDKDMTPTVTDASNDDSSLAGEETTMLYSGEVPELPLQSQTGLTLEKNNVLYMWNGWTWRSLGGTSGAMVFIDEVEALPETANEGEVYKITNTTTSNLYVYHNGEWVEISKDGVTKAEMESYIEETLLGGEW